MSKPVCRRKCFFGLPVSESEPMAIMVKSIIAERQAAGGPAAEQ